MKSKKIESDYMIDREVDEIIFLLRNIKTIDSIFDVSSLDDFGDAVFLKNNKKELVDFYSCNLPRLLNVIQLMTDKDFYDDENFITLYEHIFTIKKFFINESGDVVKEYISKRWKKTVRLYVLLILFSCVGYMEINTKKVPSLSHLEKSFKEDKNFDYKYFWYRGVKNIDEYDLFPSIYRTIKKKYVHIDDKYIDKLYDINNLRDEYNKIFKDSSRNEFLSYMQHAISFSPLIDFTNNIIIAGSFATSFTNAVDFKNVDAGIFLLTRDEKMISDYEVHTTDIELYNKKLDLFSNIFGKQLFVCSLEDFYVKYNIILNKSNDRMKYQDGLFLYIRKAVFVNEKLLFPNSSSKLFTIRIPYSGRGLTKDKIIKDIDKNYKQYSVDYIMDPYLWFGKRHK